MSYRQSWVLSTKFRESENEKRAEHDTFAETCFFSNACMIDDEEENKFENQPNMYNRSTNCIK